RRFAGTSRWWWSETRQLPALLLRLRPLGKRRGTLPALGGGLRSALFHRRFVHQQRGAAFLHPRLLFLPGVAVQYLFIVQRGAQQRQFLQFLLGKGQPAVYTFLRRGFQFHIVGHVQQRTGRRQPQAFAQLLLRELH